MVLTPTSLLSIDASRITAILNGGGYGENITPSDEECRKIKKSLLTNKSMEGCRNQSDTFTLSTCQTKFKDAQFGLILSISFDRCLFNDPQTMSVQCSSFLATE